MESVRSIRISPSPTPPQLWFSLLLLFISMLLSLSCLQQSVLRSNSTCLSPPPPLRLPLLLPVFHSIPPWLLPGSSTLCYYSHAWLVSGLIWKQGISLLLMGHRDLITTCHHYQLSCLAFSIIVRLLVYHRGCEEDGRCLGAISVNAANGFLTPWRIKTNLKSISVLPAFRQHMMSSKSSKKLWQCHRKRF